MTQIIGIKRASMNTNFFFTTYARL